MARLAEKIAECIRRRLKGTDLDLEVLPNGHVCGHVVSSAFSGRTYERRRKMLQAALEADLAPHELLQALLEESGKRQADLVSIFGSRSRVSDAVNGKRAISKGQAKRLSEYFRVSPAAFI